MNYRSGLLALALTCMTTMGCSDNNSPDDFPTSTETSPLDSSANPPTDPSTDPVIGLWDTKTIDLGADDIQIIPIPSGQLYYYFNASGSSAIAGSTYSKSQTENCLIKSADGLSVNIGNNQYQDIADAIAILIVTGDSLNITMPGDTSKIRTIASRVTGLSVTELPVCSSKRSHANTLGFNKLLAPSGGTTVGV